MYPWSIARTAPYLLRAGMRQHLQGSIHRSRSGWCRYRAVIFHAGGALLPSPYKTAKDWEARNCLPAGAIQQAVFSGGESSLSLKYTRGELTTVEFLQELGRQCFETISQNTLLSLCFLTAGEWDPEGRKEQLFKATLWKGLDLASWKHRCLLRAGSSLSSSFWYPGRMANVRVPVDSLLSDLIREEMIKQLPIMAEALQCIHAEGLKTALLMDNFCLLNGQSFLPLQKHFDVMVEPYREGMGKADPRIYKLCLERLGIQAQESIFLDNNSQNLKAAAQLGIKTVQVNDPEVAFQELETCLGFPLQGFVPYTRAVRPSVEIPKGNLQKYLEDVLGDHTTGPLVLRQFGHGHSSQSYSVRFGDHLLVLKKERSDSPHPAGSAVGREYRLLKALAEAGVPVPAVLALCEDRSTLGTPFYLMEHCAGHIYSDISFPALQPGQRRALYAAMSQVLSKIHSVDLKAAKLEELREHGNYLQQQVETWTQQYRAMETRVIPAMDRLIEWLPLHFPASQKTTVVHGDFRMDNLVFHPDRPEVLAVLGWKLAALGDPISDLANSCMAYFLPPHFSALRGLRKCDLGHLGVPTAEEYSQMYCGHRGVERPQSWNFYMAFVLFRLAAALQGRHKQSGAGKPAPPESSPEDVEFVADLAWDFAIKEGFRVFDSLPTTQLLTRCYSTWARRGPLLSRSYGTWSCPGAAPVPKVPLVAPTTSLLGLAQSLHSKLENMGIQWGFLISQPRWTPRPLLELKAQSGRTQAVTPALTLQAMDWGSQVSGAEHLSSAAPARC